MRRIDDIMKKVVAAGFLTKDEADYIIFSFNRTRVGEIEPKNLDVVRELIRHISQ